jgi:hypothetical protein
MGAFRRFSPAKRESFAAAHCRQEMNFAIIADRLLQTETPDPGIHHDRHPRTQTVVGTQAGFDSWIKTFEGIDDFADRPPSDRHTFPSAGQRAQ